MTKPRIALALGDPTGIGPEIVLKALARPDVRAACDPIVFGDDEALAPHAKAAGIALSIGADALRIGATPPVAYRRLGYLGAGLPSLGKVSPEAGRACAAYATEAMRAGLNGWCEAVVSAPHTEAAVNAAGIKFSGYPDLLAEVTKTPASDVFLMLVSPHYRVVNVTLHEPLRTAISRLDAELVGRAIGAGLDAMVRFGVARPKIGVCGLNPHAGENGLFGDEDRAIIAPAVEHWRAKGADVSGPHPADALFAQRAHDVYVAMYHDQGHIPVKTASPNLAIAVSVGTPVLFASVAHGSAHDIAGQGKADDGALVSALLTLAGQFRAAARA